MHINWADIQKRHVDPYSAEQLKIDSTEFNKSLILTSETGKGIVKGLNIIGLDGPKKLIISPGVVCISDIFIEFTDEMIIDITDSYYYKTPRFGIVKETGEYTIVVDYKYGRNISMIPIAKINILTHQEEEYTDNMVVIGNFKTDNNANILQYTEKCDKNSKFNRQNFLLAEQLVNNIYEQYPIPVVDGGEI